MKKEEFNEEFRKTLNSMLTTMLKKNHDYSSNGEEDDPFQNFRLAETLGIASSENAMLVRICDKLSRVASLIDKERMVDDERITDTLVDMANYAIIMKIYLDKKVKNNTISTDKSVDKEDINGIYMKMTGEVL